MPRLARGFHGNVVLEVARGEEHVNYVWLNGAEVALSRMDNRKFDREYCYELTSFPGGPVQSPRHYARHYLALNNYPIATGAARSLVDIMALSVDEPRGSHTPILVSETGGFIGAYDSIKDAQLVQRHVGGLVIASAESLSDLSEDAFKVLAQQMAPKLKARSRKQLLQGVFDMATKAAKPAAPEVKAAADKSKKQRAPKGDGPVAMVRKYIESNAGAFRNKSLTRAQAVDALKAQGINKGTIGVQLGKILKELKIDAEKGSRAAPKPPKAAKANGEVPSTPKAKAEAAKKGGKVTAPVKAGKAKASKGASAAA